MPLNTAPPNAEPQRPITATLLLAGVFVFAAAAQPRDRVDAGCDQPRLEAVIDRYLAAVVAHDPSRLPLSADVKYTANEQLPSPP
jgi:hypothetical protein